MWTLWSGQEPGSGAQQPGSTAGHVPVGPSRRHVNFLLERMCESPCVRCVCRRQLCRDSNEDVLGAPSGSADV